MSEDQWKAFWRCCELFSNVLMFEAVATLFLILAMQEEFGAGVADV
jgi:hypothetical protein